jgi:uncharacterized protein YbgA (DUF1722 family)/uncharacterized protein YbbK (DUF523 family)
LGQKVRYDGAHALDSYLRHTFGRHVEWVPVCPETECGMSVPREPMSLRGEPSTPRLLTNTTGKDHTERVRRWSEKWLLTQEEERLCGFIFKSGSPCCGLRSVKVAGFKGGPAKHGIGLFANAVTRRFPLLPVQDEKQMGNPLARESFIERIYVLARWKSFHKNGATLQGLKDFHHAHELLLMAHHSEDAAAMGRFLSRAGSMTRQKLFERYHTLLMKTLCREATASRNTKVLKIILNSLKARLSADEQEPLLKVIEDYREGHVPILVTLVLFKHYVQRFADPYLSRQLFLDPYPAELGLRARA